MSKQDILFKHCKNEGQFIDEHHIDGYTENVYSAMEEFANEKSKQQSIAFAEWMHKENWVTAFYKETPMHYQLYKDGDVNKIRYATPEELYNLFIEASTK